MTNRGNVFWKKTNGVYQNIAKSKNLNRCGYSRTAKFADFDLDGENELLIVNGVYSSTNKNVKSFWYHKSINDASPLWIRGYVKSINNLDLNYSGHEEACLFKNYNGEFHNIAKLSGFLKMGDSRRLVTVDLDNDGLIDVIVVNQAGPLRIFSNQSKVKQNWFGLDHVNKNGSHIPIGAVISGNFENGKKIFREVYPLNEHNGQNDPRFVFVLQGQTLVPDITVKWPNGVSKKYKILKLILTIK